MPWVRPRDDVPAHNVDAHQPRSPNSPATTAATSGQRDRAGASKIDPSEGGVIRGSAVALPQR